MKFILTLKNAFNQNEIFIYIQHNPSIYIVLPRLGAFYERCLKLWRLLKMKKRYPL